MIARARKADRRDVEGVARILVRAFDDDPIMNWICRQVTGMIDLGPKAPPLSAMWREPRI